MPGSWRESSVGWRRIRMNGSSPPRKPRNELGRTSKRTPSRHTPVNTRPSSRRSGKDRGRGAARHESVSARRPPSGSESSIGVQEKRPYVATFIFLTLFRRAQPDERGDPQPTGKRCGVREGSRAGPGSTRRPNGREVRNTMPRTLRRKSPDNSRSVPSGGRPSRQPDRGFWEDRRVLVTGGARLIGSHLGDSLHKLCSALKEALADREIVFPLAAVHGGRGYIDLHPANVASNFAIDHHVFEASSWAGAGEVVFASTACVYPPALQARGGSSRKS